MLNPVMLLSINASISNPFPSAASSVISFGLPGVRKKSVPYNTSS